DIGRLFYAETAEESELDHMRAARIHPFQRVESVVERAQFRRSIRSARWQLIQLDFRIGRTLDVSASLPRGPRPRGVDEHTAHDSRRDRKEMRAILPIDP